MHTNYALFEAYEGTQYTKIFFDAETGGFVVVHKEHGKYEFAGNKVIAMLLAKQGKKVVLLPDQVNVISADADVDSEIWEFKTLMASTNLRGAVQLAIRRAKLQSCNILCFIDQHYNANDITKGIYNAVKFDGKKMIKQIVILFQNGHLIPMTRAEVIDESFREKFSGK